MTATRVSRCRRECGDFDPDRSFEEEAEPGLGPIMLRLLAGIIRLMRTQWQRRRSERALRKAVRP